MRSCQPGQVVERPSQSVDREAFLHADGLQAALPRLRQRSWRLQRTAKAWKDPARCQARVLSPHEPLPMLLQNVRQRWGQWQLLRRPLLPRYWTDLPPYLPPYHPDDPVLEVDVLPLQRRGVTKAQTGEGEHDRQGVVPSVEPVRLHRGQEPAQLVGGQRVGRSSASGRITLTVGSDEIPRSAMASLTKTRRMLNHPRMVAGA